MCQISAQCIAAIVVGTWGVIGLQGTFMPIRTTEMLGKQCARAASLLRPLHRGSSAHARCARTSYYVPLRPPARRRTIESLEPGPEFVHFGTREMR